MIFDQAATDIAFASGMPPKLDLDALVARLNAIQGTEWRLVSAGYRFGKTLFELEEDTPAGPRRLIGKHSKKEVRGRTLHDALTTLWNGGFRPPQEQTVTEPRCWLPDLGVIVVEKAPGAPVAVVLEQEEDAAQRTAAWLYALHTSPVVLPAGERPAATPQLWAQELGALLPEHQTLLQRLTHAYEQLATVPAGPPANSHGDFHTENLFLAPGRATGIDLDKAGRAETAFDLGYFLSQTAAMGYLQTGSFVGTAEVRRSFLQRYAALNGGPPNLPRLCLHAGTTFLKNIHYDLVLLHTGRVERAAPYLWAAERCLVHQDVDWQE